MTVEEHITDILKFDNEEKLEILNVLWEHIASESQDKLSSQEQYLLDKRIKVFEAGEAEVMTWDKAKERIKKK